MPRLIAVMRLWKTAREGNKAPHSLFPTPLIKSGFAVNPKLCLFSLHSQQVTGELLLLVTFLPRRSEKQCNGTPLNSVGRTYGMTEWKKREKNEYTPRRRS